MRPLTRIIIAAVTLTVVAAETQAMQGRAPANHRRQCGPGEEWCREHVDRCLDWSAVRALGGAVQVFQRQVYDLQQMRHSSPENMYFLVQRHQDIAVRLRASPQVSQAIDELANQLRLDLTVPGRQQQKRVCSIKERIDKAGIRDRVVGAISRLHCLSESAGEMATLALKRYQIAVGSWPGLNTVTTQTVIILEAGRRGILQGPGDAELIAMLEEAQEEADTEAAAIRTQHDANVRAAFNRCIGLIQQMPR